MSSHRERIQPDRISVLNERALRFAADVLELVKRHRPDMSAYLDSTEVPETPQSPVDELLNADPVTRLEMAKTVLRPLDDKAPHYRETLYSWLSVSQLGGAPKEELASQMYLHPQTLRYRISKLYGFFPSDEDPTKSQLEDPEMRLAILLSLRITDAAEAAQAPHQE